MNKITAYEAIDGAIFPTEAEAKARDALLTFELWYDGNELFGQYEGSRVRFKELLEWVKEHRVELMTFIAALSENK